MENWNQLNRAIRYAILSSLAAGIVSILLIMGFIDMLNWTFVPCVILATYTSAYFACTRQMRENPEFNTKRVVNIALEIGTMSHIYTFMIYPLALYATGQVSRNLDIDLMGTYLIIVLIGSISSLIMFTWISIPMYWIIGRLILSSEGDQSNQELILNQDLLDDGYAKSLDDLEEIY